MRYAALLIASCLFFYCDDGSGHRQGNGQPDITENIQKPIDLDKEIIATPPALLSTRSALNIEFGRPVVPDHMRDNVLDRNPFSFDPGIKGHAVWVTPRLLRFVPDDDLPAGTEVRGTLHGKIAFGQQRETGDFTFSFKVAEQEVLSLTGDFMGVPGTVNVVRYTGTIQMAQPVDLEDVRKKLKLKKGFRSIGVTVSAGTDAAGFEIRSDELQRTNRGQEFTLTLPGDYTFDGEPWAKTVFLPATDRLKVISHAAVEDDKAEQPSYAFRFSDQLRKHEDLSGYVRMQDSVGYRVSVKGKSLVVSGDFVPGRQYRITFSRGLPSEFGTRLEDDYHAVVSISNMKPDLEWLSDGIYLPSSNSHKLQFKSVNVKRVRVTVTEIYPQNIGFFLQKNVLKGKTSSDDYYHGYEELNRVGDEIYDKVIELSPARNRWVKTEADLSGALGNKRNSVFAVRLHFGRDDLAGVPTNDRTQASSDHLYYESSNYYDNPNQYGYYYRHGTYDKLLVASDIGLTLKRGENTLHVFAADAVSARPVRGLKLQLFSFQNHLLETSTTDGDGYAAFTQYHKGRYIMGRDEHGLALLRTDHEAWEITGFDVDGTSGAEQGTNVFMYTDRGVHRPGDTVHLAAVVRLNRAAPPAEQPVLLKVTNPLDQVVLDTKRPCGANGHVYFPVATDAADPTGDWTAEITVGDVSFTKTLKVETVKPNRLKVTVDAADEILYPADRLTGSVTAKYLFGTPAAGLKAEVTAVLKARPFTNDRYNDFVFTTPFDEFRERKATVFEGNLDEYGTCNLSYTLPAGRQALNPLTVDLRTRVFEKGGNYTAHRKVLTYHPLASYAGIKKPFRYRWTRIGRHQFPLVALDHEGKPVAGRILKVKVYLNTRYWWWHYDRNDRKDFRNNVNTHEIGEYTLRSGNKPVNLALELEDQGQHYIEVTDMTSGHRTGIQFYASPWGGSRMTGAKERNFLQIKADRNIYYTGDEATLMFPSPSRGMALITLEQGSRIIKRDWIPVTGKTAQYRFKVTEDMVPNCYASISLIQPHDQTANDAPMRTYGVKTLLVEDASTRLPITLQAPDELRPGQKFEVAVTSGAREQASYTVAVVDEGLLDLTGFTTPDPWKHYFRKIRLGIRSTDNYDQIIGALFPDIDRYITIGGDDMDAARQKRLGDRKTKRFKPVVMFSGPVTIAPGKTGTTTFTMPNYVGSVKVMVVASAGNSYARRDKAVPVKQPLMVLPTVPRVARPSDIFSVPVSVFAMNPDIRDVTVSLSLSANLSPDGPTETGLTFTGAGEKDTGFRVSVGNRVGADTITVTAAAGKHRASYTVHLPVSSANPFYTELTDTTVTRAAPVTLVPAAFGLDGTNAARITFSRMPDMQIQNRLRYLIRYPYGCVEQTVSSVMPQLFLDYVSELSNGERQRITDNVNAGIDRLNNFKVSGGLSYWPGSSHAYSWWGTNYAAHFILLAKERGYHVPPALYRHLISSLKNYASQVNRKNHRYQAYSLFLLALAEKPNMGAMNLLRENHLNELDPLSLKMLAAAYYLANKKETAGAVDTHVPGTIADYRELSGTYGTSMRDRALLAYLAVLMEDANGAANLLKDIAGRLRPYGWYSTHETACLLLAVCAYQHKSPAPGGSIPFTMALEGGKTAAYNLDATQLTVPLEDAWDRKVTITSKSANPMFVTLSIEGVPLESRIKTEHNNLNLVRRYYTDSGLPLEPGGIRQGEAFWAVYQVTSKYRSPLEEIALSCMFPSGWEIVNRRVTGEDAPAWLLNKGITSGDYMDVRDDRVNWFFDLNYQGAATFAVKLNPTFKGTYVLPPASAETMYSPVHYARIKGDYVTVR